MDNILFLTIPQVFPYDMEIISDLFETMPNIKSYLGSTPRIMDLVKIPDPEKHLYTHVYHKTSAKLAEYGLKLGMSEKEIERYISCYEINSSSKILEPIKEAIKLPERFYITGLEPKILAKLNKQKIVSWLDVVVLTEEEFSKIKGVGQKTVANIKVSLEKLNLHFGMTDEEITAYCQNEIKAAEPQNVPSTHGNKILDTHLDDLITIRFAHLPELRGKIKAAMGIEGMTTIRDLVLSQNITSPTFTNDEIDKINEELSRYGFKIRAGLTEEQLDAYIACYETNPNSDLFYKMCYFMPMDEIKRLASQGIVTYLDLFLKTEQELKDKYGLEEGTIKNINSFLQQTNTLTLGLTKKQIKEYNQSDNSARQKEVKTPPLDVAIKDSLDRITALQANLQQETGILADLIALQEKNYSKERRRDAIEKILKRRTKINDK